MSGRFTKSDAADLATFGSPGFAEAVVLARERRLQWNKDHPVSLREVFDFFTDFLRLSPVTPRRSSGREESFTDTRL